MTAFLLICHTICCTLYVSISVIHAYTQVFPTSTFHPKDDRQLFHLFEGAGPKNMEPQTDEACHKHMQASSLSWFEPMQMNESYINC